MKVSVIGTGIIGGKVAELLLKEKYAVSIFNRSANKIVDLVHHGAQTCETVKEAVLTSECTILTLPDWTVIEELLFSSEIDFSGKTIIQMGTISPYESQNLENMINNLRGNYIESPILGSRKEIEQQSVILMVGAQKQLYDQYEKFLKTFGEKVYYVGPVGKAAALKLALNQIIASHVTGYSLSLGIVRKNKIDTQLFTRILKSSALFAPMYDKKLNNWVTRQYSDPNFPTKHLLKDIELINSHSKELGLNSDVVKAMAMMFQQSVQDGLGEMDYSSIYETIYREEK